MAIYDYECEGCKKTFEEIQSMADPPLTECKECGGHLNKLYHPVAAIFKGSGFYATDYGKAKYFDKIEQGQEAASYKPPMEDPDPID